jgi:hypothetical protein
MLNTFLEASKSIIIPPNTPIERIANFAVDSYNTYVNGENKDYKNSEEYKNDIKRITEMFEKKDLIPIMDIKEEKKEKKEKKERAPSQAQISNLALRSIRTKPESYKLYEEGDKGYSQSGLIKSGNVSYEREKYKDFIPPITIKEPQEEPKVQTNVSAIINPGTTDGSEDTTREYLQTLFSKKFTRIDQQKIGQQEPDLWDSGFPSDGQVQID